MSVDQVAVSSDYFDVLGLDVVSGRSFTPAERTAEAGVAVVSESHRAPALAERRRRRAGGAPRGSAIGVAERPVALVRRTAQRGKEPVAVVDGHRHRARSGARVRASNLVYLPTGPESPGTELMLRVRGNPEQARLALLERLTGLDPAFGIMTLRTMSGMQTYLLQIAFWLTVVLGGLALVLTVSGLFSVLSYLVEQQAKEIGVRMALGAATLNVVRLVLSQSLRPVGIGLAAGGGLAAAVAIVLMATPVAAEIGDSVDVFDPVAYAASAARHRHRMPDRRVRSHPACRPHRSDRDAQKGLRDYDVGMSGAGTRPMRRIMRPKRASCRSGPAGRA